MSRVRGLELLFNLEKSRNRLQSKQDCVVAVIHCLLINENLQCVGAGDEWPDIDSAATELLPDNWNSNQDVYSLRYCSKDKQSRILLKAVRMEHILMIDAAMNDGAVASLPVQVDNYVSDDFSEYSSAYKDLESLAESFRKEIIETLKNPKDKKVPTPPRGTPVTTDPPRPSGPRLEYENPRDPFTPPRPPPNPRSDYDDYRDINPLMERPRFPRVGGRDLDPFGGAGGGGMFIDPSDFGIPSRPTLPQFGVGGPGGLPRGAVPPGARFDPFMPPIQPDRFRNPNRNPDHPDYDNYFM